MTGSAGTLHRATTLDIPRGNNLSFYLHAWIMCERKRVALTYDGHTAQWGYERCWGKAISSKVPQFPNTHENHTAPPHQRGVVRLGATLSLTDMGIFLSERDGTGEASLRLSESNFWRAACDKLKHTLHRY